MVKLTVGLPLYNAGQTAWIALESLARQEGIDFDWEVIIYQEQEPNPIPLYPDICDFEERLKEIGCVHINHQWLDKWIPLSEKWRMMGTMAISGSEVFCLCGGDDWAYPTWLRDSYRLIMEHGADWTHAMRCHYYDLTKKHMVEVNGMKYTNPLMNTYRKGEDGVVTLFDRANPLYFKALRTDFMREIRHPSRPERLVDTWLMENAYMHNPNFHVIGNNSERCLEGVCTWGAGTISRLGKQLETEDEWDFTTMERCAPPFYKTERVIDEILDEETVDRLHEIVVD